MKILIVATSWGPDGSATMLRHVAAHWAKTLGWEVHALCSEANLAKNRGDIESCGAQAMRSADVRDYDLALINTSVNAFKVDSLAGKATGLPIALWVHEGLAMLRYGKEPISHWMERCGKFSLIVYQTAWQRDVVFRSFTAMLPEAGLAVVPNGIDIAPPLPQRRRGGGPFKIVCVGSVYSRKRPGDLARVVAKLAREMPVTCEFIGDLTHAVTLGPGIAQWLRKPAPGLQWSGALSHADTLARVSQADLLCLPSEDESFPLAPLEAATRGVPVLLSKLAPYAMIGWKDGENCLQHAVGDLAQIEAQIRRIAGDAALYEKLRTQGKAFADSFPLERFLRDFTGKIEAVIAARRDTAGPDRIAAQRALAASRRGGD